MELASLEPATMGDLAGSIDSVSRLLPEVDALHARLAAEHGLMLVAPDTSPRGPRLPGDDASWDFGLGAGFYVDATEAPWSAHYRMYSYVTRELPELLATNFAADPARQGM